ncbi:hypothetical protein, partial [Tateyamaria sp.]|uniref:hypothetical protein n=1 Tax=Tateyamaria sp. TaxID=1929288 RepID=UPI00329E0DA1
AVTNLDWFGVSQDKLICIEIARPGQFADVVVLNVESRYVGQWIVRLSDAQSLKEALELVQTLEDDARAQPEAEAHTPPAPKMGRPRKSDAEKWQTRFERVLAGAPADVTVTRDATSITVRR